LMNPRFNGHNLEFQGQLNTVCESVQEFDADGRREFGMVVGIDKRFEADPEQRLLEVGFYCNNEKSVSRKQEITSLTAIVPGGWGIPSFCPWGQYICGYRIKYGKDPIEL